MTVTSRESLNKVFLEPKRLQELLKNPAVFSPGLGKLAEPSRPSSHGMTSSHMTTANHAGEMDGHQERGS